ncbi:MAG: DUF1592 domain-containing protein [Nannocystales bacterium]
MRGRSVWWQLACGTALSLALVGCNDSSGGGDDDSGGTDTDGGTGVDPTMSTGSSSGGSSSGGSDESSGSTGDPPPADPIPPPGGVRRLLAPQYVGSVQLLLGDAAAQAASPPEDPVIGNYDAMGTLVSAPAPADVEFYEGSSTDIAAAVVLDPSTLAQTVPCVVDGPFDLDCYDDVARNFGRLAWRRPLNNAELNRLTNIAEMAREWDDGEFMTGVQYMLTAILQSPNFLYIVEVGEEGGGDFRELDGYEIATRLSFFLTGRTPDAETLELAASGELDSDEGVRALAESLLDQPAARGAVRAFYGEYLTVRNLPSKSKDQDLFPEFGDAIKDAMLEETMRLIDDVVFDADESVLTLFDSDTTFVNDDLAALYGVDAPGGGWERVTLPASEGRLGVLTHAGWLAMMSHPNVNSPTRRGLFVMEKLLCNEIPLPPPRVNPEPILPQEGQTLRETLSQHMTDPGCASCHALMDPIGFAFENYDATGAYRTLDNGQPIDASGEVAGIGSFEGAAELATIIAADERLPGCIVDNLYTQTLGFVPGEGQEPGLDAVTTTFTAEGHRMKRMLIELTTSPIFRQVDQAK